MAMGIQIHISSREQNLDSYSTNAPYSTPEKMVRPFSTTDSFSPHIFHLDGIHPHFEFYQCKTIFVIISLNKYQYLGERLEKGFTLATLNTKSRFCVNIYCGNTGLGSRSRIKKTEAGAAPKKIGSRSRITNCIFFTLLQVKYHFGYKKLILYFLQFYISSLWGKKCFAKLNYSREPETEPLGKKSRAGAAKKLSGSPALR